MTVDAIGSESDRHLCTMATRPGPQTRSITRARWALVLESEDLYEGLDSGFEDLDESPQYSSRRAYPVYTTSREQHIPAQDSSNEQHEAQMTAGLMSHPGQLRYQYPSLGGPSMARPS